MDLNYTRDTTSGQEGLSAIPKIQAFDNMLPIVVMTAWATIELAVDAMKRGARDFVTKPWDNQRLLTIVRTQIELAGHDRDVRRVGFSFAGFMLPFLCSRTPRSHGRIPRGSDLFFLIEGTIYFGVNFNRLWQFRTRKLPRCVHSNFFREQLALPSALNIGARVVSPIRHQT
jgi:Response regulator receiver domain